MNPNPAWSLLFRLWRLEIGALAFSTLLLIALSVLLAFLDDKYSTTYIYPPITQNTVISILVTASEACLLFSTAELIGQWKWILFTDRSRSLIDFQRIDAASRGPLGCVRLAWSTSRRPAFLHIGVLVILLSPAVDPFAQQLVQRATVFKEVAGGDTTVASAGRYSRGNEYSISPAKFDPSVRGNLTNVYADADFSMQSSVFYGLTHSYWDIIDQLKSFHCTSDDCIWPSYESLAVCSECHDITGNLEAIKSSGALYALLAKDDTAPVNKHDGGTAFRLPNGLFIDNVDGWGYEDHNGVLMTSFGTGNASQTVSMRELDTLIWSMATIRVSGDPKNSSAVWPNLPINATECALFYCIKTYQDTAFLISLNQQETLVVNATRSPQSWQPTGSFADTDLSPEQLSSIEFDGYFSAVSRTDLSIASPVSGDNYNVSQNAVDSISSFFQKNFAAELKVFTAGNTGEIEGRLNGFYMATNTTQYSPSVIQPLFTSGDPVPAFDGVATSMSAEMRSEADDTFDGRNKNITGIIRYSVDINNVQWPWLSLHVVLLVFGWLFLIATVWQNHVSGQHGHAWKSSTLAVMKQGWMLQGLLEGSMTTDQMNRTARRTDVTLFVRHKPFYDMDIEQFELDSRLQTQA